MTIRFYEVEMEKIRRNLKDDKNSSFSRGMVAGRLNAFSYISLCDEELTLEQKKAVYVMAEELKEELWKEEGYESKSI